MLAVSTAVAAAPPLPLATLLMFGCDFQDARSLKLISAGEAACHDEDAAPTAAAADEPKQLELPLHLCLQALTAFGQEAAGAAGAAAGDGASSFHQTATTKLPCPKANANKELCFAAAAWPSSQSSAPAAPPAVGCSCQDPRKEKKPA